MHKFIASSLLGIFCVLSSNALAKVVVPSLNDLPVLKEESQHQTACSRTANYFLRSHYKTVTLDNAFADKVIFQYLRYLDYSRSLFTQSEIDNIYENRIRILKALNLCDLSYPYELYNLALKKRFNKYITMKNLLSEGSISLDDNDSIEIDRTKATFAQNQTDLKDLWIKELKNDLINQIVSGKDYASAVTKLTRRYDAFLSRLAQTNSEDVFSTFENAFATAIDPHTNYLSPIDSDNFNDDINLSLEGIGAVLTTDDEYTIISDLVPGSPASASKKLKKKDKIVGVRQEDGTYDDIIGWRLYDVVKKIKGPKGTKVTLDIERETNSNITNFKVTLIRDKIKLQDREAKGKVVDYNGNKIGVITIQSFYTDLHKDLQREIVKLNEQNIKSLVLDLRSNGGGLLPEATLSTGLFIKDGPVVLVRDAQGTILPQVDTNKSISYTGPLVVLINRLSASSSEIMAAALRDYGRAVIVGETSFGKGTVQQNRPLSRVYDFSEQVLGSVHYTIAKFYRINGGSTQLKGVEADILLPSLIDDKEFGESTELNALQWDRIQPVPYNAFLNLEHYIPKLKEQSALRSKDNEVFDIFKSESKRYQDLMQSGRLSLNLKERQLLKEQDDAIKLDNINTRLALMGKEPIEKLDDLEDDFEFEDVILDEAVAIADDFATLIGQKEYKASEAPILTRFKVVDTDGEVDVKINLNDSSANM